MWAKREQINTTQAIHFVSKQVEFHRFRVCSTQIEDRSKRVQRAPVVLEGLSTAPSQEMGESLWIRFVEISPFLRNVSQDSVT